MRIDMYCNRGTSEGYYLDYRVVQFSGESTWNVEDRRSGGYREFDNLADALYWIDNSF